MRCRTLLAAGVLRGLIALPPLLIAASCDTVDLGAPPADVNACHPSQQFFYERVWPEFLGKDHGGKHCSDAGCHSASASRVLILPPPTSAGTLPLPADWAAAYQSATKQMFCTNAGASPLVVRPSRSDHGGGKLIEPDGPESALIREWVAAR
jgi:hypothetical protein